jgi:hypothetical protein
MIPERRHSPAECEKEIARDARIAITVRTSSGANAGPFTEADLDVFDFADQDQIRCL